MQTKSGIAQRRPRGRRDRNQAALEGAMDRERRELAARWEAIRLGTLTTAGTHWAVARINEVQDRGALDELGGVGHIYRGTVGEGAAAVEMWAQVVQLGGDVAVTFWPRDGRARRLLVTARGEAYIEVWTTQGAKGIAHSGKFVRAWNRLAGVRVGRAGQAPERKP